MQRLFGGKKSVDEIIQLAMANSNGVREYLKTLQNAELEKLRDAILKKFDEHQLAFDLEEMHQRIGWTKSGLNASLISYVEESTKPNCVHDKLDYDASIQTHWEYFLEQAKRYEDKYHAWKNKHSALLKVSGEINEMLGLRSLEDYHSKLTMHYKPS